MEQESRKSTSVEAVARAGAWEQEQKRRGRTPTTGYHKQNYLTAQPKHTNRSKGPAATKAKTTGPESKGSSRSRRARAEKKRQQNKRNKGPEKN